MRPYRTHPSRANRGLLVAGAALLASVWLLPLALGAFAIADPQAVYQTSPAEARTPWAAHDPTDRDRIGRLIPVVGAVVLVLGIVGLALTVWPFARAWMWGAVIAVAATGGVVAFLAWLHSQGYWATYPAWLPALAWVAGLACVLAAFVVGPAPRRARPPDYA